MTLRSPDCPVCGHPPQILFGEAQAFCGNDDCNALMWNPSITPAENLAGIKRVEAPGSEDA